MSTETKEKTKEKTKGEISSHFAFGEHWNEQPEFIGYKPADGKPWQSLKDDFYLYRQYGHHNPLPLNIQKGNEIIGVYVHGFRVPDSPPVITLGTDAATKGRIVFCKTMAKNEYIAIAW